MNNDNNQNENDDFEMPKLDVRQENEFKKMKMNLEHGAIFPDDLSKQLPPEIESQFLDSIINFEKAFRNARQISVFDKIGRPDFIPENVLNDNEIEVELERIEAILDKNGLGLDVLADYEDEERLIYKFITEELFLKEIEDIDIEGFNSTFIYENFHQNHRYDLDNSTIDFLQMFLNKKSDLYNEYHSKDATNHEELNAFRDQFKKLKLKSFSITDIVYDENNAKTTFELEFTGKKLDDDSKIKFFGTGTMTFKYEFGYWYVQFVNLPI